MIWLLLPLIATIQHAEAQVDLIEQIRNQAKAAIGPNQLGAAYAAMLNFAENPDIATARYYIDSSAEDPTLHVVRFGGGHIFKSENRDWSPFIKGYLPYQTLDAGFNVGDGERIDTRWKAIAAELMFGVKIPVTPRISLSPAINLGYARLENKADYTGELSQKLLKPALEGFLFDWSADTWMAGASLWADYEESRPNADFRLHGGIVHNYIRSFNSSSPEIDFSDHATVLTLDGEVVLPTGMKWAGYPIAIGTGVGGTTLLGPNRDELGFSYFFDAGLFLEADISDRELPFKKVRLGAKGITGDNVVGWSAVFGFRF